MRNDNPRELIANVNEQVLGKLNPLRFINPDVLRHFSLFSSPDNLTTDYRDLQLQKQLALGLRRIRSHGTKLFGRGGHLSSFIGSSVNNAGLVGRICGISDVGCCMDLDPCQSLDFGFDLDVHTRTGGSYFRGSLESSRDGGALGLGAYAIATGDSVGIGTGGRRMYCGSGDAGSRDERIIYRSVIPHYTAPRQKLIEPIAAKAAV